ncbi:response regulator [Pseudomonas matsuisoli]|uniref:response regulator n=1 Tax=Pseudomonas matsuisoli TaxID=1515666 RepID=UPI00166A3971|nr:response regulator transcription factor [Pseudomonas matsuisoli]
MRPRILVVDDDDEIRELVCDYLNDMGYRTRPAANGREMWSQLEHPTDLVILDVMLPGEDGLSLCRGVRSQGDLPVVMISARGASTERIIGLEIGADDYLCKPFEPRELLARVRAVLRRGGRTIEPQANQHALGFAGWRLDLRTRRLFSANGETFDLSRSDFMILRALGEKPNRIFSRDELSRSAFGRDHHPADRSVDVCVSRLRQYLEDNARNPRLIRTIRNEGYLLELAPDAA